MKLKNKYVTLALFGILVFSLAIKYPTNSHQFLPDSPDFHVMTNLVNTWGRPIWSLHPLSNWGAYPFSEPLGIVFIMSSISQLTHLHVEQTMILMNAASVFVGILSFFCISNKIFKNASAGLLSALFFSFFGYKTLFIATPRPIAGAFIPFIFLLLYFTHAKKAKRGMFIGLFLLTLVITFGIHRLTFFIIPLIVIFLIIVPIYPYFKKKFFSPMFASMRSSYRYKFTATLKIISVLLLLFTVLLITLKFLEHLFERPDFLYETALFQGESMRIMIINFIYYMGRKMGPSSVFAVFGLVFLLKKSNNRYETFLFLGMIGIIPFSIRHAYIWDVWPIFIFPLAGYGFYRIAKFFMVKERLKSLKVVVLAFLLLSPVIITTMITIEDPFRERESWVITEMTHEEWEAGIYFGKYLNKNQSAYSRSRNHAFAAISNRNHLRMGMHNIELIWANQSIIDELDIEYRGDRVLRDGLDSILLSKGVFYIVTEDPLFPERERYYGRLHFIWLQRRYGGDEYDIIVDYYRLRLINDYKLPPENWGAAYERTFMENVRNDSYKVYENAHYESYNVPYPNLL